MAGAPRGAALGAAGAPGTYEERGTGYRGGRDEPLRRDEPGYREREREYMYRESPRERELQRERLERERVEHHRGTTLSSAMERESDPRAKGWLEKTGEKLGVSGPEHTTTTERQTTVV